MCLVGTTDSHYGATTFMLVVENDRICRESAFSVGEGGRVSAKAMRRPVPAAVVQRRTRQSLVSTMPAQCFIRPSIQRSSQYTVHAAQAHSALTWFSPPVEAVARGVAAEQSPATWSHRPNLWAWYVDVIFVVIERDQVQTFKERLNAVFSDVQFTMEKEERISQLAFLDVLVCRKHYGY
nr:unnamed protein product [Spirometra erinaceieuropaei]